MKLGPQMSRVKDQPQADEIRRQRLLEVAGVIPWEADAQTWVFTYVGPQAKALLGYPPEQWYEKDFWVSKLHPEDRDFAVNFCETSSKTLTEFEFDYRMIAADGRAVWLHDVVNVVTESGTPRMLRGFMMEITARKRAEVALREAHEQLKARDEKRTTELRLTESRLNEAQRIAKIGNWDWNLDTDEVWWSEERYRIAGQDPETFKPTQKSLLETVHPEDQQRVLQALESAQSTGGSYSMEFRMVLPDGSVKNMCSQGDVFCDQEGRSIRIAGTTQDITERVALEREVVAAGEHERNRLGRELHDDLGQELATISYGLTSLSKVLEREQSSHTESVQNLAKMTKESLEASQRLAQAFSPELSSRLGFKAALMALVANVNRYSNVTCRVHYSDEDDDPYDLEAATHLYRIAQEAINNALKHSGAQNIDLRYGRDRDRLILEVLDDGVGIPPEESRGEGMGLRSMHYRARMLRGRLRVALGTHGGTRVFCSCPAQPQ